ncbi:LA_0442/LA_0875 N-terminal domain-containing protein [Leptospira bandrabouensis]|uniref:LA_0442/LA_0875 N-terminal domain-containing protein n=1 Tax=Leptospira bandrabouensis TaxID=2484903 RepID=UPI001EEB1FFC|nr:hypothetical protein [Leptospira bandrabouensis]MCG6146123.1 hypothetical protein [Leptospira bandrabouensis]MCG6165710.1 hypothetical protein [Leptospira bandrabouensis]
MNQKIILSIFFLFVSSVSATNILLRSGGILKGKVINQDGNQIEILDENGKSTTVPKTNVLKVVYKEHSEQELAAIRKEEERKLILATQAKQSQSQKNQLDKKTTNPIPIKQFVISHDGDLCEFYASKSEWFWLYGNFPITNQNSWIELLPEEDRPIRISFQSNWLDTTVTILLGSLTSISRKTRIIEICEF